MKTTISIELIREIIKMLDRTKVYNTNENFKRTQEVIIELNQKLLEK